MVKSQFSMLKKTLRECNIAIEHSNLKLIYLWQLWLYMIISYLWNKLPQVKGHIFLRSPVDRFGSFLPTIPRRFPTEIPSLNHVKSIRVDLEEFTNLNTSAFLLGYIPLQYSSYVHHLSFGPQWGEQNPSKAMGFSAASAPRVPPASSAAASAPRRCAPRRSAACRRCGGRGWPGHLGHRMVGFFPRNIGILMRFNVV